MYLCVIDICSAYTYDVNDAHDNKIYIRIVLMVRMVMRHARGTCLGVNVALLQRDVKIYVYVFDKYM